MSVSLGIGGVRKGREENKQGCVSSQRETIPTKTGQHRYADSFETPLSVKPEVDSPSEG